VVSFPPVSPPRPYTPPSPHPYAPHAQPISFFSLYADASRVRPFTYLLTPWCRFLLEKLNGLQIVKKFLAFHGTRRFITALTTVRHLSLSWASPIQSIYPHPTSWRSVIILSTHLRLGLPSGLLPSGFPTKNLYTPLHIVILTFVPEFLLLDLEVIRN